jgi:hypothetical protein
MKVGFVGALLKKHFGEFQSYLPTSSTTQITGSVTMREDSDKAIGNTVDRYESDWGTVELHMSRWLIHENFGGSVKVTADDATRVWRCSAWPARQSRPCCKNNC